MKKDIKNTLEDNYKIYKKTIKNVPWVLEDIKSYNNGKFFNHPSYIKMNSIDGGNVNWLNFIRKIYLIEQNDLINYYILNEEVDFRVIKKLFSDIVNNIPEEIDKKKSLTTIKNLTKKQFSGFLKYQSRRKLNKKLASLFKTVNKNNYSLGDDNFRLNLYLTNFLYFNDIERPSVVDDGAYHMVSLSKFVDNYNQNDLDATEKLLNELRKLNDEGKLNFNTFKAFYFEVSHKNRKLMQ